ncbi:MAG: RNA ligase family protein, partial [Romboutsia sp.]
MKKYRSTTVYGSSPSTIFEKGDIISITEKIDGSNTYFELDEKEEIGISCYSRREKLYIDNNLRGFYQYVERNIVPIKDKLQEGYLYYGEWLCSHKVKYKEELYNKFYLFAIWDKNKEIYLQDREVFKEAERLGIRTPEQFYYGQYISYEHLKSFVGKSNTTKELNNGEGIVIKGCHKYKGYNSFYSLKIVADKYVETKRQRVRTPKKVNVSLMECVQAAL